MSAVIIVLQNNNNKQFIDVQTCMWSPASTTLVLGPAKDSGINMSHSRAWAASSRNIWVKNPTQKHKSTVNMEQHKLIIQTL